MSRGDLTLYAHQVEGVNAILRGFSSSYINAHHNSVPARGFLLCDQMGLGKTVQALCAVEQNLARTEWPTLVVCPASVIDNVWAGPDYQDFFTETFPDLIIVNSKTKKPKKFDNKLIMIVSYTTLGNASKKDSWIFAEKWGHLILDEVHRVKNASSVKCKAVASLDTDFRLALSGTPILNHGGEMLSLFRNALKFTDLNWLELSTKPRGSYTQTILSTFVLGRKRNEISWEKPPPVVTEENLVLSWDAYEAARHEYRVVKEKAFKLVNDNFSFLQTIQRLRQICVHPRLVSSEYEWREPSPKMIEITKICKQNAPGKVVVVCEYRKFLQHILQPWLAKMKIYSLLYCGESRKAQQEKLRRFHTDPDIQVLLLVKQAGGIGINLQAAASTLIIVDPHFNAGTDDQAAARVDRIGQTKPVHIYRLFMQGSIDIALLQMQRKKRDLTEPWQKKRKKGATTLEIAKLHLDVFDTV